MAEYGFTFDPFKLTGVKVPASRKEEAMEAVSDYLKETALSEIGAGRSPVAGGPWKRSYTPEYKERKEQESSAGKVNLELHGDLLNALDVKQKSTNRLFYGVDGDQAGKAEGNNIGSYGQPSGNDEKARRFIPLDGETFKPSIVAGMKRVLEGFTEDDDE